MTVRYRTGRFERRAARKGTGASWAWWLLGAASLAGATAAAVYFTGDPSGTSGPTDAQRGFRLLDGCKGFEVIDEPLALKFARGAGGQASVYAPEAGYASWALEAGGALGLGSEVTCDPTIVPPTSLAFAYRLAREYFAGAVAAKKMSAEDATAALLAGRTKLLFQGVDAALLPEGLPE